MDIVLGTILLAALVALQLLAIVAAHHARLAKSNPVAAEDRTKVLWNCGG